MNQLKGIHHVTAITSSAEKIYEFFTYILGMRLVKKTINQDDIDTYHLFFADDKGNPGTDMTFFDFKGAAKGVKGTNEISRTGLRVPSDVALKYWQKRFEHYDVTHQPITTLFDRKVLMFHDFDDQAYMLVSDEYDNGVKAGTPWVKGPVPNEYAIVGLGPIFLRVNNLDKIHTVLTENMFMRFIDTEDNYSLYEMGEGGNGARVIVDYQKNLQLAMQGYGSVHHVAFRIEDKTELDQWINHLDAVRAPHSGFVDRFYFKSLYTRLYRGLLFEFATEGPGFIDDEETYETLGETLALPPKFRNKRTYVESVVRHIDTVRSTKTFKKETFENE
ncbi:MAG: ring-cleaving dioxygenase [Bacillota bacterium]